MSEKKPRKPRAPRKKKAAEPVPAPERDVTPTDAPLALDVDRVIEQAQARQPNPPVYIEADPDDLAERQAIESEPPAEQPEGHAAQNGHDEPSHQVEPERVSGNGYTVERELLGAKPRRSGRRAWDINLGPPGFVWERVVAPPEGDEPAMQVFRFKDAPGPEQRDLIAKYDFGYDEDKKEASRPDDVAGRNAGNKLAWYLKGMERAEQSQGAAVAV